MTAQDTAALAFLGFLIGLTVALVLFLGDHVQPRDVWTPATCPGCEPVGNPTVSCAIGDVRVCLGRPEVGSACVYCLRQSANQGLLFEVTDESPGIPMVVIPISEGVREVRS